MADDKPHSGGRPGSRPSDTQTEPRLTPRDPLKDGLKAVARGAPSSDAEKTALINRSDRRSKMWLLQDALKAVETALDADDVPPTQAIPGQANPGPAVPGGRLPPEPAKTQLVRGPQRPARSDFRQEPVVGWVVIIGGPGLGAFRPIHEGNNSIGRSATQRIPLDFGDDAISGEEQAYIRYDSSERSFLFVPNLAKTNIVSVNQAKPTAAVTLAAMDVITIGRTQLVFVPFCGEEFDWSDLADLKE